MSSYIPISRQRLEAIHGDPRPTLEERQREAALANGTLYSQLRRELNQTVTVRNQAFGA
jgi:hypothetical protein